jgi:hypothetical protein
MIYQFEIFRNLNFTEKKTFRLHLVYSIIEGIILGVIALNEIIFLKGLEGTDFQLGVLAVFQNAVLLFAIFFNEFLKRYKDKKNLIKVAAIFTRTPLLFIIFFPADISNSSNPIFYHYTFLFMFFAYFMAKPIIFPIINLYLKKNYKHENFGKLFSYSSMANKVFILLSTFSVALLLDKHPDAFRYIYPAICVLSIVSIFILSKIRIDDSDLQIVKTNLFDSIRASLKGLTDILKKNKPYRDFEIGFMLYGFAWLSGHVLFNLFFVRVLDLNYSSVAFYKNFYNTVAIFLSPFFGKLMGNIDPRKFAVFTFSFLLLTILFTALTQYFPYKINLSEFEFRGYRFPDWDVYLMLMLAYVAYGFFAASMPLLWGIGSAYFCKPHEAADYQSIHLSLTGLRATIAPILGVVILNFSNFSIAFGAGILSLSIAIGLMFYSMGKKYG